MTPFTPLSTSFHRGQLPTKRNIAKHLDSPYVHTRVTTEQRRLRKVKDWDNHRRTKNLLCLLSDSIRNGEIEKRRQGRKYDPYALNLSEKLRRCHRHLTTLTCGKHIERTIPTFTCEFRLCPHCARRQANNKVHKYIPRSFAFVKLHNVTPCHLVLTQPKKNNESLKEAVNRLLKSFKKLYRRQFFKAYFKGGLWSIEFTFDGESYHVHLHVLVFRSKWFDVARLKSEWSSVGGGENLRLDRITDIKKGIREVLKYISKPSDIERFTSAQLQQVIDMKGRRFMGTFGEFHNFSKGFDPEDYAHILNGLEDDQTEYLQEGDPCPKCGDPLFELQQNEDSYGLFLTSLVAQGRSP